MPLLEVVEPEEMYDFARANGLLADPSQPRPRQTLHRLPPVDVLGPHGLVTRLDETSATTTTSFRVRFPQADIWGLNLLPVIFDGKVLPGGFSHQSGWVTDAANRTNNHGAVDVPPLPVVDVPLERPQLLGYASHWGHFFTDTLDRLLALRDGGQLGRPLLSDALPPCTNALDLMYQSGLLTEEIEVHQLKRHCLYRARNLEVLTLTSRKPSAPVHSFVRLRQAMYDAGLNKTPLHDRALFVGRQQVLLRKITNQEALAQGLQESGLANCIYPELMSIGDAARAFAASRTIVLPIGSAKFNLIFCRPGTRVICVAPRGYAEGRGPVSDLLRHMCEGLGLDLAFYGCASTSSPGPYAHMLLHHDLHIDVADVRAILGRS
jgi:Glycosyltransferase 61